MSFGNTCDIPSQECHVAVDDIINSNFFFEPLAKRSLYLKIILFFKHISEFRFYFNVEQISLKIEGMPLFLIDSIERDIKIIVRYVPRKVGSTFC